MMQIHRKRLSCGELSSEQKQPDKTFVTFVFCPLYHLKYLINTLHQVLLACNEKRFCSHRVYITPQRNSAGNDLHVCINLFKIKPAFSLNTLESLENCKWMMAKL